MELLLREIIFLDNFWPYNSLNDAVCHAQKYTKMMIRKYLCIGLCLHRFKLTTGVKTIAIGIYMAFTTHQRKSPQISHLKSVFVLLFIFGN